MYRMRNGYWWSHKVIEYDTWTTVCRNAHIIAFEVRLFICFCGHNSGGIRSTRRTERHTKKFSDTTTTWRCILCCLTSYLQHITSHELLFRNHIHKPLNSFCWSSVTSIFKCLFSCHKCYVSFFLLPSNPWRIWNCPKNFIWISGLWGILSVFFFIWLLSSSLIYSLKMK